MSDIIVKTNGLCADFKIKDRMVRAVNRVSLPIVQFNMFIVKNYFESLPESVEESARIDGAGDLRTLVSIGCGDRKSDL